MPASAGAATFGADLNTTAVDQGTCGSPCLIFSSSTSANYYAPFSGIVNTVRIKTADVPQGDGQAQIVVFRSYFQNNPNSPGKPNFSAASSRNTAPRSRLRATRSTCSAA